MDDPLGTWSQEFVVVLGCPVLVGQPACNIPLPRQSHLGKYEGLRYRPSYGWRETFLCLRHGRAFVCSPDSIHLEVENAAPKSTRPPDVVDCMRMWARKLRKAPRHLYSKDAKLGRDSEPDNENQPHRSLR